MAARLVGFVGLGSLGGPMAARLVDDGHRLVVSDIVADRVASLVARGARSAADTDLGDCTVVMVAVPDDDAVVGLLEGDAGLLRRLPRGAVVVVHSTLLPATVLRLEDSAAALGVDLLDAPVSGGPARASTGDLTVMVGGSERGVATARPILESVGSEVHHVGPAGSGAAVKLANQTMLFAALAGVFEGLDVATAYGVPEADVLAVVSTSLGESWVTRHWGFFDDMVRDYDEIGTPLEERSWRKDLRDVVEVAGEHGLRLPVAELLARILAARVEDHAARHSGPPVSE
ncbi:MAG: NAD(P)-dependent oxidoreductase [Nocardioides sp.]